MFECLSRVPCNGLIHFDPDQDKSEWEQSVVNFSVNLQCVLQFNYTQKSLLYCLHWLKNGTETNKKKTLKKQKKQPKIWISLAGCPVASPCYKQTQSSSWAIHHAFQKLDLLWASRIELRISLLLLYGLSKSVI